MFRVMCIYVVLTPLLVCWERPCLRRNSSSRPPCLGVMAAAVEGPVLVWFGLGKWSAGMERVLAMLLGLGD